MPDVETQYVRSTRSESCHIPKPSSNTSYDLIAQTWKMQTYFKLARRNGPIQNASQHDASVEYLKTKRDVQRVKCFGVLILTSLLRKDSAVPSVQTVGAGLDNPIYFMKFSGFANALKNKKDSITYSKHKTRKISYSLTVADVQKLAHSRSTSPMKALCRSKSLNLLLNAARPSAKQHFCRGDNV